MPEKDLAATFKSIFSDYPLRYVVSKSDPGWPDRLIQLPNSRICFAELKVVKPTLDLSFFTGLAQEQAVWLSKWQIHGGLCFLMFVTEDTKVDGPFMILTMVHWKDWLQVPKTKYKAEAPVRCFTSRDKLLEWFVMYTNSSAYPDVFKNTFW